MENTRLRQSLLRGLAIPACPLALNAQRALDGRRVERILELLTVALRRRVTRPVLMARNEVIAAVR